MNNFFWSYARKLLTLTVTDGEIIYPSSNRLIAMPYTPDIPNRLAFSNDGIIWEYKDVTGLEDVQCYYYMWLFGNLAFANVAAGIDWDTSFKVSQDGGLTWNTMITPGNVAAIDFIYSMDYNGSIYMMANNNPDVVNPLSYSINGIEWIGLGNALVTSTDFIGWLGGRWIAVGKIGWPTTSMKILTSDNGIDWVQSGTIDGSYYTGDLIYDGTQYVLAVYNYTIDHARVYTSTDGSVWELKSDIVGLGRSSNIIYYNGTYIITGRLNSGGSSVYTSTDLITWTPMDIGIYDIYKLIRVGDTLIAGGIISGDNMTVYSNDGITWIPNGLLTGYDEIDDIALTKLI